MTADCRTLVLQCNECHHVVTGACRNGKLNFGDTVVRFEDALVAALREEQARGVRSGTWTRSREVRDLLGRVVRAGDGTRLVHRRCGGAMHAFDSLRTVGIVRGPW